MTSMPLFISGPADSWILTFASFRLFALGSGLVSANCLEGPENPGGKSRATVRGSVNERFRSRRERCFPSWNA